MKDKRRFFILTLGRTGSSLLASILSDAGADFGDLNQKDWDRTGGAFEHPKLVPIVRNFQRMEEIGSHRPYQLLKRVKWDIFRHNAKKELRQLLAEVQYVKGELEHTVHWAARLGYEPTVIVSYRRFGPLFESMGHMHPQLPEVHARQYVNALRNGLGLAAIYGGCVIDYEEIIDSNSDNWAGALAASTGLSTDKLLSAREDRVDLKGDNKNKTESIEPFSECGQVYQLMCEYQGRHIPAARATRRAFDT